jgi:hypothetical protein
MMLRKSNGQIIAITKTTDHVPPRNDLRDSIRNLCISNVSLSILKDNHHGSKKY